LTPGRCTFYRVTLPTFGSHGGVEFIGDAHISVESVAVTANTVLTRVHTGWNAPLLLCLHYMG